MEYSGLFISFEGIDGSGKSTQASLLFQRILKEGFETLFLREPGGTAISEKIRRVLLDVENARMETKTEFLLYAASRAQLVEERIKPGLESGKVVVCDRFADSSLAYQGYGRVLDIDMITEINSFVTQNITPDLTFIIDLDLSIAEERSSRNDKDYDRIELEKDSFKQKVIQGYRSLAGKYPKRIRLLDGNIPKEALHEKIWEYIAPKLELIKKKNRYEKA